MLSGFPTINMRKTGQNITRLRKSSNLTVDDLKKATGVGSVQAIYKWQSGKSLPSIDNLVVLSMLFHVSINDILVCDYGPFV